MLLVPIVAACAGAGWQLPRATSVVRGVPAIHRALHALQARRHDHHDDLVARADYARYLQLCSTSLHEVDDEVAQASDVVRFDGLLSEDEVNQILKLADTTAATSPDVVFDRSSWSDLLPASGMPGEEPESHWQVVFLQANHVLQTQLPAITSKLRHAARVADARTWNATLGVLDEHLGIRCAEVHTQKIGGGLPDPEHRDYGSLITLDVMLSDANAFEGGQFTTTGEAGRRETHAFSRGSALAFLSLKRHGVRPVTAGERRVLVVEFWQGVDVSVAGRDEGQRWLGMERSTWRGQ
mmetsp:Transcript_17775/g.45973  ORF Transcript_17775/g.45973 Transcript_17775/m.45973 type:complete len:296 (-) Transcript_17775:214-1101(-)